MPAGDVPFPAKTTAAVKAAMRDDAIGGMTLYTKTGTHRDDDGSGNVWWIGWIEGARRIALGKALPADASHLPAK